MKTLRHMSVRRAALTGVAAIALITSTAYGQAAEAANAAVLPDRVEVSIEAQSLDRALAQFADQTGIMLLYTPEVVGQHRAPEVRGEMAPLAALSALLNGSDIGFAVTESNAVLIGEPQLQRVSNEVQPVEERGGRQPEDDTERQAEPEVTEDGGDGEDASVGGADVITVTGTNIRGIAADSSPSFVFDRQDIELTGASTVADFIRTLPQSFGGGPQVGVISLPNDRTASSNQSEGSSINLRGVGSGATLVLLNGRRIAPAGSLGSFVDISMIPLSAVERVEIVTDGASALYGADAVGGVVNFILRDDYVGAQTFASVGSVTDGDMWEYRGGATFGRTWANGSLVASYEYLHRDDLSVADREFASATPTPNVLSPAQQSHNFLLSASQELGANTIINSDILFSQRQADISSIDIISRVTSSDADSEQLGASVGAIVNVWGDWQLDLQAGVSDRTEINTTTLLATGQQPFNTKVDSSLWSIDAKADGLIVTVPGGELRGAFGASFRREQYSRINTTADRVLLDDTREVIGLFGELFIPIVGAANRVAGIERLEFTIAGRYDEDSDFGSTLNPKYGVLWSPINDLVFRGSYSESFNPPDLGDTGRSGGAVRARFLPNNASPTGASIAIVDFRAPDLGPEESESITFGVDYSRNVGEGRLDMSATWYEIKYTDRIASPGSSSLFLNNFEAFQDLITVNPDRTFISNLIGDPIVNFRDQTGGVWMMPGDEEFYVDGRITNLAIQNTTGIDINADYTFDTDVGRFDLSLSASYIFEQVQQVTATSAGVDLIDTIFSPADLRMRARLGWDGERWDANLFMNYVDDYRDIRNIGGGGDLPIDDWTTFDFGLGREIGAQGGRRLLDDIKLSLNIQNLLNENPPSIDGAADFQQLRRGYDPANANPIGRFVTLRVSKEW